MSSFDEWWEKNYMLLSADRTEAEDIYNIGAQSRQAEIDELQKRIDEALKELELLDYYRTGNSDNAIKILKGAANET